MEEHCKTLGSIPSRERDGGNLVEVGGVGWGGAW